MAAFSFLTIGIQVTLLGIAGWVFGALAAIGALASAYVKVRSSVDDTTANIWKGEAEAQKARAERLEMALSELSERVGRLEAENRRLAELVTGAAAIAELRALVIAQHEDIRSRLPEHN
jgi:cell shape-determining protein MreC